MALLDVIIPLLSPLALVLQVSARIALVVGGVLLRLALRLSFYILVLILKLTWLIAKRLVVAIFGIPSTTAPESTISLSTPSGTSPSYNDDPLYPSGKPFLLPESARPIRFITLQYFAIGFLGTLSFLVVYAIARSWIRSLKSKADTSPDNESVPSEILPGGTNTATTGVVPNNSIISAEMNESASMSVLAPSIIARYSQACLSQSVSEDSVCAPIDTNASSIILAVALVPVPTDNSGADCQSGDSSMPSLVETSGSSSLGSTSSLPTPVKDSQSNSLLFGKLTVGVEPAVLPLTESGGKVIVRLSDTPLVDAAPNAQSELFEMRSDCGGAVEISAISPVVVTDSAQPVITASKSAALQEAIIPVNSKSQDKFNPLLVPLPESSSGLASYVSDAFITTLVDIKISHLVNDEFVVFPPGTSASLCAHHDCETHQCLVPNEDLDAASHAVKDTFDERPFTFASPIVASTPKTGVSVPRSLSALVDFVDRREGVPKSAVTTPTRPPRSKVNSRNRAVRVQPRSRKSTEPDAGATATERIVDNTEDDERLVLPIGSSVELHHYRNHALFDASLAAVGQKYKDVAASKGMDLNYWSGEAFRSSFNVKAGKVTGNRAERDRNGMIDSIPEKEEEKVYEEVEPVRPLNLPLSVGSSSGSTQPSKYTRDQLKFLFDYMDFRATRHQYGSLPGHLVSTRATKCAA